MNANEITAHLLIEIPWRFPGAKVWRSNRVDVMAVGKGGKLRRVMAGIDGQADITGIFPRKYGFMCVMGLRCEIEVKAAKDKQSPAQKAFEKMILDAGGIYIVARSVKQCLEDLGRWV